MSKQNSKSETPPDESHNPEWDPYAASEPVSEVNVEAHRTTPDGWLKRAGAMLVTFVFLYLVQAMAFALFMKLPPATDREGQLLLLLLGTFLPAYCAWLIHKPRPAADQAECAPTAK